MNILYCGDNHIADGLMLSILSLLEWVDAPLNVYVMTIGCQMNGQTVVPLDNAYIEKISRRMQAVSPQNRITLLDATTQFLAQPPLANLETRFTPCCMLRLYADQFPQLPDRLLYLDNDVLCRGDCRVFYEQAMDGCPVAGVLDYYGRWFFRQKLWRMDYLNSGVLLLNLPCIRETGLFAACRRRCAEKKMLLPDQSALNALASAKKQWPRRYNEQRKLHPDTVFQHFTTTFRLFPWFHKVTVKPWQTERMHTVLKLHAYDDLLAEFQAWKADDDKQKEEIG